MTIALPSSPLPQKASVSPVLFGGPVLAELGGEDQWINRAGARWQLDVQTPQLKPEPDGRIWTDLLARAWFTGERVTFPVPQPGLDIGNPGPVKVRNNGITGSVLTMRDMTPGYVIRPGQFFSIRSGGRGYLYRSSATAVANGSGETFLPLIVPMHRVSPLDGDSIEFLNPAIEGLLIGDSRGWTHTRARTEGLSFTIRETR